MLQTANMHKMLRDCGAVTTEFFMSHNFRDRKETEKKKVPHTGIHLLWEPDPLFTGEG